MRPRKCIGSPRFFLQLALLGVFVPQLIVVLPRLAGFPANHTSAADPAASRDEASGQPNIVLILVDDMGYGDAKCYNPESKIETPAINELAAQGMRFTDAHAPGPLCHMSRYGLLTGRYPFRTDVSRWPKHPLIDQGQTTIASLLKSAGYHTAMVGKWHLGFAENGYDKPLPGGPVDVGFDEFFGIRASTDIPPYFYIRGDRAVQPPTDAIEANQTDGWSPIQGEFWRAGGIAPDLKLDDVLPTFTDEAVAVIDRHAAKSDSTKSDSTKPDSQEPLFLYVALPAPHTPWLPSSKFQGSSDVGLYGDFVMMVDAMVGRIVDRLTQARMNDNTLIIFTSDNGPVWYDNDVDKFGHDSCGSLRGMKGDAWEAGHRMPFLVRWPGNVRPGSVSDQMVCFTDVLATFADITHQSIQDDPHAIDSASFLPALLDPETTCGECRDTMALTSGGGALSVRDENWKWIERLGSSGFSQPNRVQPVDRGPTSQLYDLSTDLAEQNNVALEHPERVTRMRTLLQQIKEASNN
ncbi:sulfatase family protein [Neorhodopirellula pilleata]|uniref:Choline-sulfatase n=1 Tax=Neorhodopirellula pilleata TaxID=2714738 RepID=A0A5C6AD82_9BACT|nr:arylsulfatase [Neorhodopirellula pilleata]TWT97390.1 Choline-sulfatase [Neorhodopirellula pilleata]